MVAHCVKSTGISNHHQTNSRRHRRQRGPTAGRTSNGGGLTVMASHAASPPRPPGRPSQHGGLWFFLALVSLLRFADGFRFLLRSDLADDGFSILHFDGDWRSGSHCFFSLKWAASAWGHGGPGRCRRGDADQFHVEDEGLSRFDGATWAGIGAISQGRRYPKTVF